MRRRSRAALATAAVAALVALLAPGAAFADDAGSVTHTSGAVTATIAWDRAELGVGDPRLFVVRQGVRYDLTIADVCEEGCILVPDDDPGDASGSSILKVADLDGDGEPEVLVDTFSGGAHCCLTARLLTWNGTGYTPKDFNYGDVGYQLKDLDHDGRPELVGCDPVFSGAFTAFAASAFPPLVLHVERGRFVDVTRRFPSLVRKDAAARRKDLRKAKKGDDVRGILAAYVADQYLLGRPSVAARELTRQRQARRVSASFKPYLLKKLHAWGYR
ncbi:MAG TPA: hypothetical protein VFG42_12460 [Baekduia sp.]|uniref:hypothetical protein n=1 Tax=Baekduia sp. TaxID=2600305 RepID=UPI002D76745D|nr:hypothetical protein [Baekduia sp.]HET6507593.1 hypothetical protein [Baekduia sp.]